MIPTPENRPESPNPSSALNDNLNSSPQISIDISDISIDDPIYQEDILYEQMCNWYDRKKEENLASWGVENLDEIGHDW